MLLKISIYLEPPLLSQVTQNKSAGIALHFKIALATAYQMDSLAKGDPVRFLKMLDRMQQNGLGLDLNKPTVPEIVRNYILNIYCHVKKT